MNYLKQVVSGKGKSQMKLTDLTIRKNDSWGSGAFGASRGGRKHNGVDLVVATGSAIKATFSGTVTKIGYPYGDDLSYRYVQITNSGYDLRIFYVDPCVSVGDEVTPETVIGKSQDLNRRYNGITPHVHFEIKRNGEYVDPTPLFLNNA